MAQVTLYLDEATHRKLRDAAAKDCKSRSAWLAETVRARLKAEEPQYLPPEWFAILGTWEDDGKTSEEILAGIRAWPDQQREPMR